MKKVLFILAIVMVYGLSISTASAKVTVDEKEKITVVADADDNKTEKTEEVKKEEAKASKSEGCAESTSKAKAEGCGTSGEKAKAESLVGGALGRLQIAVEAYPDLKANQNFLALQEELTSTENKISYSRQSYNDQVLFFNNKIQMFPSNVIAGMFNFRESEFFELEDVKEKEVPKVSF